MARYAQGNDRKQVKLLPACPDNCIVGDKLAHAVDAFEDELDRAAPESGAVRKRSAGRFFRMSAAVAAGLLCCATLAFATNQARPAHLRDGGDATVIVVPLDVPNPTMDAGCWVQLWSGPRMDGESFAIVGPAEILALDQGTIRRLQRNVGSLLTGPKAKLTVFTGHSLRGKSFDVPPDTHKTHVEALLGPNEHVLSLRLSCVGP